MSTTPSTNMSLPIPGVGSEAGPTWATDLNNCLTILDLHDHSSGLGVKITPSGININSELTFQNNQLTNAQILGMYLQGSDPTTLGCLYYKGVDLYFNDGSSNHIRMTASGSVSGASGTITGLPTGTASASYNAGSGVFVFQSATNAAADVDGRSFILRNSAASSKGLTLSPPAAMGADIAMTFPAIPASTQVMTMTSGGAMGTVTYNAIADARTRTTGTTVGIGGVAISSSSGTFSTSSTSYVDVTNLSVTITTSGRPIRVSVCALSGASGSFFGLNTGSGGGSSTGRFAQFTITRDGTQVGTSIIGGPLATSQILDATPQMEVVDNQVAGTYNYKLQVALSSSYSDTTVEARQLKLVAYEL